MAAPFIDYDSFLDLVAREPRLRIVDTRSKPHGAQTDAPTGAQQYAAGHMPGAMHLDYAHELADPATPYATRVAPVDRLAKTLGEYGIGDESVVVAYDDGDVPYAARFVWMMRYLGRDDAMILAGGLKEWRARGGAITFDVPTYPKTTFTPHPRERLRATRAEVLAIASGENRHDQLLETQRNKTYALRDRDIAGVVRLSGNDLLEDANGGRIAPPETLEKLVDERNLDRSKRTIVTCGSGVSASGAYLALLEAGFTDLAVYDGSWLEWSHDELPSQPKTSA
jgi:thiosulfate/3-mercaptopyruvate sulfurtransferase